MNNKTVIKRKNDKDWFEIIKWVIITIFLCTVVIINYSHKIPLFIKIFLISFFIVLSTIIAWSTKKGRQFIIFTNEANNELRKVGWPNYKEAIYTTLLVITITILIAMILWGLDSILVYILSYITGL